MSILSAELVALLERLAKTLPLPNVRALHLPALSAAGTRDGEFCAIELDDGSPGLSFVLLGDTLATLRGRDPHTALAGTPVLELARRYADSR